jgi:ribosomal protein S18 acetylase RimI-like enzyme
MKSCPVVPVGCSANVADPGHGEVRKLTGFATRLRRAVRQHGLVGASRATALRLFPHSQERSKLTWYRLDLSDERPHRDLEPGLELRRGTVADSAGVADLPVNAHVAMLSDADVVERLRSGAELWVVAEGDRIAFACWVYYGEMRFDNAIAKLPRGTVLLEDSILSPDFRGRKVPAAAWTGVANRLEAAGVAVIMTKVDITNAEARWAFRRAGFREVAEMEVERRAYRRHAKINLTSDDESDRWLASLGK